MCIRLLTISAVIALAALLERAESDQPAAPVASEPLEAAADEPLTLDLPAGEKRALILCGHPGDADHREGFTEVIVKLHGALVENFGYRPENIWLQFGSDPAEGDDPILGTSRGKCSLDEIKSTITQLAGELKPADSLWVIVLGHAYFDGRRSSFNIPGPDVDQEAFGRLFSSLKCREEVYWLTLPASGFFIPTLSREGRVIITATESSREINETNFPHVMAELLTEDFEREDVDADGRITVFDFYIALTKRILEDYAGENTLATEHANLDDNGDGRGSEVQLDYLSPELGGRRTEAFQPKHLPGRDGTVAARIPFPVFPKRPDAEKKDAAETEPDSEPKPDSSPESR